MQPKQLEDLSYATADLPIWQRRIIRTIERFSGQRKLCRVYHDFLQRHTEPLNFWHDAAASLQHNSRLFNFVSQFSQTLRLALLFHETSRKIGGSIDIVVGGIFNAQQLVSAGSHDEVTEQLCHATLELERLPLKDSVAGDPDALTNIIPAAY